MFETTRKQYLKAMGVDLYRLKSEKESEKGSDPLLEKMALPTIATPISTPNSPVSSSSKASLPGKAEIEKGNQSITPVDDLSSYMAMDEARGDVDIDAEDSAMLEFPLDAPPSKPGVESLDWDGLKQHISTCQNCELHQSRTQTVFGVGNPDAEIMIIGEAPGQEEDAKGEPFVGRAGQLLDNMLKAIGLDRKTVFIANILKCRPPANRNPSAEEALACEAYLLRQIDLISPKLILSVGGISAKNLLKTEEAVGRLRSQKHKLVKRDIPVLVTYHPAYLLRKPSEKAKSWADLKKLRQLMKELGIHKQ